jgi:hypothetical protein
MFEGNSADTSAAKKIASVQLYSYISLSGNSFSSIVNLLGLKNYDTVAVNA